MPRIKEIDIDFIRQHKNQVNWGAVSAQFKFTIDQLREFKELINWDDYFQYHYHQIHTIEEVWEFKDRSRDWGMMFYNKKASKQFLKKWIWEIVEYDLTWEWVIKNQKLDKEFLKPYLKFIENDELIGLNIQN